MQMLAFGVNLLPSPKRHLFSTPVSLSLGRGLG